MHVRLRPAAAPSLHDRAAALRALASLLRAGLPPSPALQAWDSEAPVAMATPIRRIARLVALGVTPRDAIAWCGDAFGDDLHALRSALELQRELGIDPVPVLERAARAIEWRADSRAAGRAAAAGAKLSGYMVGGLPLVSLPLLPMAEAPLLDPAGLALLFFGLVLTAGGMFWMARLVPVAPSSDDPLALFADHLAAALGAGAALSSTLEVVAAHSAEELRDPLSAAARRALLGERWPDALEAVDPCALGGIAAALRRASGLGVSPETALEAFAAARRAAAVRAFERAARRAPVLMVLPLVLCVLPAFGLLAVVPFLRGITLG